ncbi:MAG: Uma2 family endonuclease [Acidobacteriota bacterium]|nr:Uma2 family endonuclease [Acidobacteriota bacterium]
MATQAQRISVAEYLEREAKSLERHEYLNGEVFLMAGGSPDHAAISTHISTSLDTQLANTDCNVRGSDMGIRTNKDGLYFYADVVVSCGKEQFEGNILLNPVLIVKVLSENTDSYDRGKKFELYREIESFTEYLIVAQDRVYIEHWIRDERLSSKWTMRVFKDRSDSINLQAVPAIMSLTDVYRKVL